MSLIARFRGHYPPEAWVVLHDTWSGGISVQSDYARSKADLVAFLASVGWITTIAPDGYTYTRRWRLSPAGLEALAQKEHFLPCSPQS